MTSHEEKAKEIVKRHGMNCHFSEVGCGAVCECNDVCNEAVSAIASALEEAVRAENEACAKVAEADDSFMMLQDWGLQSSVSQKAQNIASAIRSRCHDRPEQVDQSVSAQAPLQTEPDRDAVKEEQEAIKEIIRTVATDQAVDGELYIISAIMKAIDERSYAR